MAFKKSISVFTLLASSIAGIVGSGWLLGPLACVRIVGPGAWLSWLIGGFLMMFIALSFVFLTRALPGMAGGSARFFQMTYGHFAGFSFSWIAWLAWVAVSPAEVMALLQYSANYIPGLMTLSAHPGLTHAGMGAAVGLMVLMVAINNHGMKVYSKVNQVILAFKILVPVITVTLIFKQHFNVNNFTVHGKILPYGWSSVFSSLPLAGVIYSFIGFNPAIQLAAETKNPRKAIPIAIFGSLAFCMVLYTLVQIAFIGAIPTQFLQKGWHALTFVGDKGPFAGLLASFGFVWFIKILYLDAAVSPFGTALVQANATGRLSYAMSQNSYFPKWLQKLNRHNAPGSAMILNLMVGLLFLLPFPSWQKILGFLVSCLVLGYVIGPMSLLVVGRNKAAEIGYPKWLIMTAALLAFYVCNLMIFWSGWLVVENVAIAFAIGYVVLGIKIFFYPKPSELLNQLFVIRGSWVVIYIIGLAIISKLSTFGGTGKLAFGMDFWVLALFTIVVFAVAAILSRCTQQPSAII